MINVCKCEFKECTHSQECKRFMEAVGEIINFKVICNGENDYEWIIKVENAIAGTEGDNNEKA